MDTEEELAGVFQALSDPLRLRVLELLPKETSRTPISVCDLAKRLGVSQPNASHHLKILKSAGLIRCDKRGGCSYYQVDSERVRLAMRDMEARLETV
jgi:ArsR family transcriptional regulator